MLCDYELQRLQQIKENEKQLHELGLSSLFGNNEASKTKERKAKAQDVEAQYDFVDRRTSSRLKGTAIKSYRECTEELTRMDKIIERAQKDKVRSKICKPKRGAGLAKHHYKNVVEITQPLPETLNDRLGKIRRKEFEKFIRFNFKTKHLKRAEYPQEQIELFEEFGRYINQSDDDECSSFDLEPYNPRTYVSNTGNPRIICKCGDIVCLTEKGVPRKHDCI